MEFVIYGTVREKESGRPIPGLLVRAFDRDLLCTDLLGTAITQSNGSFVFGYQGVDFRDLFEQRPDIFLDIYGSQVAIDPASSQAQPIHTTRQWVRFNAGRKEYFLIEIPRDQLGDDAPGHDIVNPPQEGAWKDAIDGYIKEHPLEFQYDPDKGFMAPVLHINSDFTSDLFPSGVGDQQVATMNVTNLGNGASFNTYVELYDGPWGYQNPLRDYRLCKSKVISIQPGQKIAVKLTWTRMHASGRLVGICYDPFLDPRGFNLVQQIHRHIASIHYASLP